jgi:hypothetical protein
VSWPVFGGRDWDSGTNIAPLCAATSDVEMGTTTPRLSVATPTALSEARKSIVAAHLEEVLLYFEIGMFAESAELCGRLCFYCSPFRFCGAVFSRVSCIIIKCCFAAGRARSK